MDSQKLWPIVLERLKIDLSAVNFATWFPQTFIINIKSIDENRQIVEIGCPNKFAKDTIETRYYGLIKDALDNATNLKNDLIFVVKQKEKTAEAKNPDTAIISLFEEKKENPETTEAISKAGLRLDFNLENFAVSSSNQMAHAAAQAVIKSPGKNYNPLFLYGGVGVGKTHLMQAVGQAILNKNPKAKVIYCMGEEFTNDIIIAIRNKTTPEFRQKYRSVKVLMVDDIQFIAGKDTVQQEFFHTFNAIWRSGGQIIITSDRRPEEIKDLEARLRSRFEGGLIVDIQPPDFELRTAILLIKAQQHNFNLPMDLAQLIASNIASTRKLEGFLMTLISENQTKKTILSPELVTALLGQTQETSLPRKIVQPKEVIRAVAGYYNLKTADLIGSRRFKPIAEPRQIVMYLLRTELNTPLMEIGRLLGKKDHTTVMHGVEKITRLLPESEKFRVDIVGIKQRLYG